MRRYHEIGNILPATMAASAIMSLITSVSFFMVSLSTETPLAKMDLNPTAAVVTLGDSFTTSVEVEASSPVNAYTGIITFDHKALQVARIDYNTSIADLWAEKPWYQNGDGTIHFAGGTTKSGGFTGRGALLTITFTSIGKGGETPVRITKAQVRQHDGLGTEAELGMPIDGLFTVVADGATRVGDEMETAVVVRNPKLTGDLNNDGKVGISDISIFFTYLATSNTEGDINGDGRISTVDLSILVSQM